MRRAVFAILVLSLGLASSAAAGEEAGTVLLDTASLWRWQVTWGTDLARLGTGK